MLEIYFVHDQQESPAPRKRFLELAGYRVTLFESGTELLTALAEHKPDLILMDVLLPGPHGFDVCRLIRHQYGPNELPVVLTSGVYRARVYREEAAACGAQAYLLRPRDLADLANEITRAIDVARASAPAQG